MIDQLIQQLVSKIGIDENLARQGVGIIMGLLKKEGDAGSVSALFDKIPGAADLAGEFEGLSSGGGAIGAGGMLGGLMGKVGGMLGGNAGDALSAMAAFKDSGLSVDQAKDMAPVVTDFLKENAGEDLMKQALGSVPTLKGFLG